MPASDELILIFISEQENKQIYKQKPNKKYWEEVQSPEEKDFYVFCSDKSESPCAECSSGPTLSSKAHKPLFSRSSSDLIELLSHLTVLMNWLSCITGSCLLFIKTQAEQAVLEF